jgi:class 3 adenylate cyclase
MLHFLREIGITDSDTADVRTRKYHLLVIACLCSVLSPLWAFMLHHAGLGIAAYIPLLFTPLFIIGIISLSVSKNEKYLFNIIVIATLLCPFAMQWLAGGLLKGGLLILWAFFSPWVCLIFRDIKRAKITMSFVVVFILVFGIFNSYFEQWGNYIDRNEKLALLIIDLMLAIIVTYLAMEYFVKEVNDNKQTIKEQNERSDSLLLNILPEYVADELKQNGKTSPTLHENATIIFSDFKDFTQFSELFTPEELIGELAKCFETFDEIITKHGLEKIKTIGDAYMCVGGISKVNDNTAYGAERAVLAAMEMAEYIRDVRMKKLSDGKTYWDVRIGVHTGDIVAGIVGKKKFVFDIWGDAVNVANRLQTCSEEGRINISDTTYRLVKDYFICSPRGKIAVKNKGELDMYFVDDRVLM